MKLEIVDNRSREVYFADDAKDLVNVVWGLVSNQGETSLSIREVKTDEVVIRKGDVEFEEITDCARRCAGDSLECESICIRPKRKQTDVQTRMFEIEHMLSVATDAIDQLRKAINSEAV